MTVTQINYFLTVTECGSFSAAAAELFVSQPAVSKQISQLESELGFSLFDRVDRRIRLTENGRLLYTTLRRFVDEIQAVVEDIRRSSQEFSGELRIGCMSLWNASLFFTPLRDCFAGRHPDVSLTLEAYDLSELARALRRGEIDIAMSYEASFDGKADLLPTRIKTLECGLLYSRAHFQDCGDKGRHAFDGVPVLVGSSEENVFAHVAKRVLEAYGLQGKIMPNRHTNSIIMDTLCGGGVMLVTEWTRLVSNAAFGYTPLGLEFPVSAAYLRGAAAGRKLALINEAVWTLKNICA